MTAELILWNFSVEQGWNDKTQLMLALEFINEHGDLDSWERYLREIRNDEEDYCEDLRS